MRNCTFRPQIRAFKSPRVPKKESEPAAATVEQQPAATTSSPMNINNEQASSIVTESTPQAKLRSKDLMPQTGNKCNDLFELSKQIRQIKGNNTDRTTIDLDYEKNKAQCTFKPKINSQNAPSDT